ncbi:hypothetical protein BKA66DRAFT_567856 [Pyrenochaeta sp. MPI-SDFR-AT-0127]|nr:hypothetical protein BKA66DRAFT_567856 [Pyrenochaeta sp. MPI-SDFR-AT-0127]
MADLEEVGKSGDEVADGYIEQLEAFEHSDRDDTIFPSASFPIPTALSFKFLQIIELAYVSTPAFIFSIEDLAQELEMWYELQGASREAHKPLLQVLRTVKNTDNIENQSKNFDTLKDNRQASLPLMRTHATKIDLDLTKLLSGSRHILNLEFSDGSSAITAMLSLKGFYGKLHFQLAHCVDEQCAIIGVSVIHSFNQR